MHWKVRLDDEHGRFWLQSDHRWSDCMSDGLAFATVREADQTAARAKASVKSGEWHPRIKVISFKGDGT
jgi:hypothetical protein